MEEEEEHFEFVDKRRTAQSQDARGGEYERAQQEPQSGGKPQPEETQEHPRLAAMDRLFMCLDILQQGAWIALGLVTDPVTNKVERNLEEAQQLIDAVAAICEVLDPAVEEPVRRDLRNLVANLRLNYVNQVRRTAT